MPIRYIRLYNNFHGTSTTVKTTLGQPLSPRQIKKCRQALCGSKYCTCGDNEARTRGPQTVDIEPTADGRIILHARYRHDSQVTV
jgi:hypothetical protein